MAAVEKAAKLEAALMGAVELLDEPRRVFIPFVATVLTPGLVRPLSVYAAGRKSFEVMTCCEVEADHALALIFARMNLEEFGWSYETTAIGLGRRSSEGFPIWRLERG